MAEIFKITPTENSVKVDITWDDSSYPTGSAVAAYVDITEGINYIAIVGETATATFAIKYIPKKVITINNSDKAYIGEGKEYTFGSTGYGYYNTDTKEIYKAGSKITVGDDMNIVSIDKLSVNLTNGAAIRIDDNQAGGIRFKADVDVTCGVDYVYSQDNGDEYSESVIRTIKGIANSIFEDKNEFGKYSKFH